MLESLFFQEMWVARWLAPVRIWWMRLQMNRESCVKACGMREAPYRYSGGIAGLISSQLARSNYSREALRDW